MNSMKFKTPQGLRESFDMSSQYGAQSQMAPGLKKGVLFRQISFKQSIEDYCLYRWMSFRFLKERIQEPLNTFDLLDLDDGS